MRNNENSTEGVREIHGHQQKLTWVMERCRSGKYKNRGNRN